MDINARLKRVTDLFTEGTEVYLGNDETGTPVVIWVNKLNSFEVDEARHDGIVQRGMRMAELGKDDNPERMGVMAEVAMWSDEQLANSWAGQKGEEGYLEVLNDIEADEEWREKIEWMRRMPTLLDDAEAAEDDPRRQELADVQTAYLAAIRNGTNDKFEESRKEALAKSREDLERSFFENWRERQTLDLFMAERRITELWIALRVCQATEVGRREDGSLIWDHSTCNHSERLLEERKAVKSLPPAVVEKCVDAIDSLTMSPREAGNSDAPASSSASSEPSNGVAADLTPSTPAGMPSDALTT